MKTKLTTPPSIPVRQRTGISRRRSRRDFSLEVSLSDRATFPIVHRYISDPSRYAVQSNVKLRLHGLVEFGGAVLKIANIEREEIGLTAAYYYEIKVVMLPRLQATKI